MDALRIKTPSYNYTLLELSSSRKVTNPAGVLLLGKPPTTLTIPNNSVTLTNSGGAGLRTYVALRGKLR
ncbi:hypothetical protein FACS1894190_11270 [Spirochaetia bacterium]|nr:hypothetical protein FACS1894190_11270 [Spirochaetia bacterium]